MSSLDARRKNKIRKQNRWLRDLCSVEDAALDMVRPIDLATMEPEVVECRKGAAAEVFNYWRVALSSEPQLPNFAGAGRSSPLLVRDKVSGGFLGVIALSDPPNTSKPLMRLFGWDENDGARRARQHQVLMMRRCLPLYEFGQMTGGKMLALAATSRDVIRFQEIRFSFQYVYFVIRTLHGKGSQYNRLHQRGIELVEVDGEGKGFYAMELRRKGLAYMRTGEPFGRTAMYPLADQIDHWKERWLEARLESTGKPSLIVPDRERYRLSAMLDAKQITPSQHERAETNDADAGQED
jgi:Druantia protein DruA